MTITMVFLLLAGLAGPATAEPDPATSLSGTWKGTLTLARTGDCPVDPEQRDVRMEWVVEDSGIVLIESVKEEGRTVPETWQGQLDKDLKVTLLRSRTMRCDRDEDTSATRFTGAIELDDGTYHLKLEAEATWCPRQKCSARLSYELSRAVHP